jgi:hypothetical protein
MEAPKPVESRLSRTSQAAIHGLILDAVQGVRRLLTPCLVATGVFRGRAGDMATTSSCESWQYFMPKTHVAETLYD